MSAQPDFKNQKLCDSCWNGNHYLYKSTRDGRKTSIKVSACQQVTPDGEPCECHCRALLAEAKERREKWAAK